jgi:hypothetical protein
MTAIQMALLGGAPSPTILWDLKVFSVPAGLNYYPGQSTLQTQFSTLYGYQTAGDASGSVYELQTAGAYSGNYLFQTSVLVTNSCSDPALAIFTANGSSPVWAWSQDSSRISVQCNCTEPVLYGTSASSSSSGTLSPAPSYFITIHLWHEPLFSRTRSRVTVGLNDWTLSGSQIGSEMSIANNYGSTPVYCGLASDFDDASLNDASTNFQSLRVTKL